MLERSRHAAYVPLATDQRTILLSVAYLTYGSRSRAETVVEWALAQRYVTRSATVGAVGLSLSAVLHTDPARLVLPWRRGERFQLVDDTGSSPRPAPIVTDLAGLPASPRRVVVLEQYLRLEHAEIASLLSIDPATVATQAQVARARLVERDSRRAGAGQLPAELGAAVEADLAGVGSHSEDDLAHGQLLLRRGRLRRLLGAVAVLTVVALGGAQVVGAVRPDPGSDVTAPAPVASPRATCDTRDPRCQSDVVSAWRSQMAQVSASYVDPEGEYFSGYTFSFDDLYDSQDFWRGKGGALGFRLSGQHKGPTEVYVQMATSAKFALPCGQLTRQSCAPLRFMDGNVFTLTSTTFAREGIEAQYSPRGDEVITVVARNTSKGGSLEITRAQLISLIQDPRLRLPRV